MIPEIVALQVSDCSPNKCPLARAVLREWLDSISPQAFKLYKRYVNLNKETIEVWAKINEIQPPDSANWHIYEPERAKKADDEVAPFRRRIVEILRQQKKIFEIAMDENWYLLLPDD